MRSTLTTFLLAFFFCCAPAFAGDMVHHRVDSTEALSTIYAEDLTIDTYLIVDATSGFAGLRFPPASELGIRTIGIYKDDHTSNPLVVHFDDGAHVAGYNRLSLPGMGDSLVIGCDGVGYFIVSRSEAQKQPWAIHRTHVVSSGGQVYGFSPENDRHAMVRVNADVGLATIYLPNVSTFVIPNGYRNTYTAGVMRSRASSYPVQVCPPPGKTINGGGCLTLTAPDEVVVLDFDSAEWFVVSRY